MRGMSILDVYYVREVFINNFWIRPYPKRRSVLRGPTYLRLDTLFFSCLEIWSDKNADAKKKTNFSTGFSGQASHFWRQTRLAGDG